MSFASDWLRTIAAATSLTLRASTSSQRERHNTMGPISAETAFACAAAPAWKASSSYLHKFKQPLKLASETAPTQPVTKGADQLSPEASRCLKGAGLLMDCLQTMSSNSLAVSSVLSGSLPRSWPCAFQLATGPWRPLIVSFSRRKSGGCART